MDSKYLITKSGGFVGEDDLYHWGIKGMKWGVRRYQNADGSLTSAGRKRYTNPDGSLNEKGKKKFGSKTSEGDSSSTTKASSGSSESSAKRASDMSDSELQTRVNRLRNEDAYRDLSKKLGYDGPKTELDIQIAAMEKEKRYLELQRDIKNLTPKKVSRGKKLLDTLMNKVVEPAATEAGKEILKKYLTEAGMKTLKKEKDKIKDTVTDSAERVKKKEAKKEAKQAEKESRRQAEKEAKSAEKEARRQEEKAKRRAERDDRGKVTVEGEGASSRPKENNTYRPKSNDVIDMEPWGYLKAPTTSITTYRNTSAGSSYVSQYRNTPVTSLPSPNISGYLPAPKDDDD